MREDEGLERVLEVAAAAREAVENAGLLGGGGGAFTPHVTVAKLSKLPWRSGLKRIPAEAYAPCAGISGGSVLLPAVQLCRMGVRLGPSALGFSRHMATVAKLSKLLWRNARLNRVLAEAYAPCAGISGASVLLSGHAALPHGGALGSPLLKCSFFYFFVDLCGSWCVPWL